MTAANRAPVPNTVTGAPMDPSREDPRFVRTPNGPKDFLGTYMLTLGCSSSQCDTKVRIGRVLNTQRSIGPFRFCPVCGAPAHAHHDTEESYWEMLARSFKLPIDLVKMLYEEWDPNEHANFRTFVEEMQAEASGVAKDDEA